MPLSVRVGGHDEKQPHTTVTHHLLANHCDQHLIVKPHTLRITGRPATMGETHRPVHEYFCERDIPLADNGGGTDSQWKRYADILPHLERLEVNGIEREEAFLQQYSALPLALFKHPEFAKRHGQAIRRTTHFAFALVDKALTRRLADGRKTALEMHDGARLPGLGINNPYISIQLTPAHARNQASITAYRGLEKTTYYCGQKPGTSIFRYKGRKESFSFDEGDTILSQSWEPAEMLSFESELGQQEGAQRDDFEYVGYVPRHVVEVVARLRKVSGDVVAFLAGCLAYGEHERTGAYNHKYRAWMHLGAGVTESDAAAISRDWSEEFKPGHVFPRELSVYARDVRAVTEFVLLIDVLEHSSSGHVSSSDLTMFRTLRGMLLRVCNLSDKELIALEYRREADQAFALLLGQYATDQCFVYEDPSVDVSEAAAARGRDVPVASVGGHIFFRARLPTRTRANIFTEHPYILRRQQLFQGPQPSHTPVHIDDGLFQGAGDERSGRCESTQRLGRV